jgi:hypothetical protein
MKNDTLRALAQAAYEAHSFPEDLIIDDQENFESEDHGTHVDFRRQMYYFFEGRSDEDDESYSQIAHFNVRIDSATMEIGETYCILSSNGGLLGEFTQDSRREAYEAAGIADPQASSVPAR